MCEAAAAQDYNMSRLKFKARIFFRDQKMVIHETAGAEVSERSRRGIA